MFEQRSVDGGGGGGRGGGRFRETKVSSFTASLISSLWPQPPFIAKLLYYPHASKSCV